MARELSERIGATISAVKQRAAEESRRAAAAAESTGRRAGRASEQAARRGAQNTRAAARGVSSQADSQARVDSRRTDRQRAMFKRAEQAGQARAPIDADLNPTGRPDALEAMARGSLGHTTDDEPDGSPTGLVQGIGFNPTGSGGGLTSMITGPPVDDGDSEESGGWLSFQDSFGLGGGER
jgi:hypothetical protein